MKTLLILAAAAAATPAPKPALAPSQIVAAAPKGDWVAIAASDLLVMDLASGKRVMIQLMPPPFSQGWVGNIRKLAAARFWDGTSINRVQDNYVVQWGDATEKKALPNGLIKVPQSEYVVSAKGAFVSQVLEDPAPAPFLFPGMRYFYRPSTADSFRVITGFARGFQFGQGDANRDGIPTWPVHCYGMVGVGRGMPPDTGTGAELYTVIGHAPRHLDRNIALVGRVISGIEHLSSLPRGTGPLGFYEKPEERVTITSIRIGTEVKDVPRYEYLSTESASFAAYADARANRRDPFFIVPAGGADICNIPVPVRVSK